jgi:hypothetical protein
MKKSAKKSKAAEKTADTATAESRDTKTAENTKTAGYDSDDSVVSALATVSVSSVGYIDREILIIPYVGNDRIQRSFGSGPLYFECIGPGTFFYKEAFRQKQPLFESAEVLPVAGTYVALEHIQEVKKHGGVPSSVVTEYRGTNCLWIFGISGGKDELSESVGRHKTAFDLLLHEDGHVIPADQTASSGVKSKRSIRIVVRLEAAVTLDIGGFEALKAFRKECIDISTEIAKSRTGPIEGALSAGTKLASSP